MNRFLAEFRTSKGWKDVCWIPQLAPHCQQQMGENESFCTRFLCVWAGYSLMRTCLFSCGELVHLEFSFYLGTSNMFIKFDESLPPSFLDRTQLISKVQAAWMNWVVLLEWPIWALLIILIPSFVYLGTHSLTERLVNWDAKIYCVWSFFLCFGML